MKAVFWFTFMTLAIPAFANPEDVKENFFYELCIREDRLAAAEIIKSEFFRSMDGRLTLDERKAANNLGTELRNAFRAGVMGSQKNVCEDYLNPFN